LRRQGESAPRCQIERLMGANGLCGAKRRGTPWRTTVQDAQPALSPDLLDRDFSAERPDKKWCADFTYIRCWEGIVFFSFVIDCYSRMIVGWQFAGHMRTSLVGDALDMAVAARRPDETQLLIHHSDRGSQYTSAQFNDALADHGVRASLGSTGDAYDNALAESFVDSFKTELIAYRPWRSRSQLELAIVAWVGWYNHQRLHSSLNDMPPVEFEATAPILTRSPSNSGWSSQVVGDQRDLEPRGVGLPVAEGQVGEAHRLEAADAVLDDGVLAMTGLQAGEVSVGLVGDEALKAVPVVIAEAQLRAGVRALSAADKTRARWPRVKVDVVGQLGYPRTVARRAITVDRRRPRRLGQRDDCGPHRLGQA
jgi:putative transposase